MKYKISYFPFWILSTLLLVMHCQPLLAAPASSATVRARHHEFVTPAKLRPRVEFWKLVFGRYGKDESIIHHREFPQVIFDVIDFRDSAAKLKPIAYEVYRKKALEREVNRIKSLIAPLAEGKAAESDFELRVQKQMEFIRGGKEKYKRLLTEDLIRSQTGIREKFLEAIVRSGRYLPMMEKVFVKDFRLPIELTRLPFVESSFDYTAYSSVGAAGIWQFMPRTAKQYMTVNSLVDERRDPIKSTEAAAKYLTYAYAKLGTWPLAMTSYNHGVGGVMKQVRAMGTSDLVMMIEHQTKRPFGFASNNFYPSFLAALELYEERESLFPEIEPEPALVVSEMRLPTAISVREIAERLDVEVDTLRKANYALSERIWAGNAKIPAGYTLKVPEQYELALASIRADTSPKIDVRQEQATSVDPPKRTYKVVRGDTLSKIAKRYGVSVRSLIEVNGLAGTQLKAGESILIPDRTSASSKAVPEKTAPKSSLYVVRKGDTLSKIASRHGLSTAQLKKANNLRGDTVRIGQKLKITR